MDNKESSNIGDEIKGIVQSAINSKDFAQLNSEISKTVANALNEVRTQLSYKPPTPQNDMRELAKKQVYEQQYHYSANQGQAQKLPDTTASDSTDITRPDGQAGNGSNVHIGFFASQNLQYKPPAAHNVAQAAQSAQAAQLPRNAAYNQTLPQNTSAGNLPTVYIPHRNVGQVAGPLCTCVGIMGLTVSWVVLPILSSLISFILPVSASPVLLPFLVPASALLLIYGAGQQRRTRRMRTYLSLLKRKGFASIQELAASVRKTKRFVIRDLQRMLSAGMFPQGHFDDQYTCFIGTNEYYNQYRLCQDNAQSGAKTASAPAQQTVIDESKKVNDRVNAVIKEGNNYIAQIRKINDDLPDEDVSNKLDLLETTITKIFNQVDTHPEQLAELDKFMQYYLPTTIKLLTVYRDFEQQPIQGENITTAKKEILGTLDTINQAFIKLFDSLFQATAWDVSTDITVLEAMLAQEGLTQSAFEPKGD